MPLAPIDPAAVQGVARAGRLRYTSDTVEVVARDFGYASHTAFTRAFKRQFGQPPSAWRATPSGGPPPDPRALEAETATVRLRSLAAKRVLARRYFGPRSLMADQWRDFLGRLPKFLLRRPRLGLAYDDPSLTPPDRIRYDCAVEIEPTFRPPQALLDQGLELLDGRWACSEAEGVNGLALAYRRITAAWMRLNPGWTMEGDPHLELFEVTPEEASRLAKLSVCLRMQPQTEFERPNLTVEPVAMSRRKHSARVRKS